MNPNYLNPVEGERVVSVRQSRFLWLLFVAVVLLLGGCAHDTRRFAEPSVAAVGRAATAVGDSVKASKELARGIEAKGTQAGSVEAKKLVSRLTTAEAEVQVLKDEVDILKGTVLAQTNAFKDALEKGEKYDRLGHQLNRWFYFGAYWYAFSHQMAWILGVLLVGAGLLGAACFFCPALIGPLVGFACKAVPGALSLAAAPARAMGSGFVRVVSRGKTSVADELRKLEAKTAERGKIRGSRPLI
jgi:hypothetical protein